MLPIRGIIRNGQVVLKEPAGWPDGTEVVVDLVGPGDEEGLMAPDEIARVLALMEQVVPFDMTVQEEAVWQEERKARKEREIRDFFSRADKVRDIWE